MVASSMSALSLVNVFIANGCMALGGPSSNFCSGIIASLFFKMPSVVSASVCSGEDESIASTSTAAKASGCGVRFSVRSARIRFSISGESSHASTIFLAIGDDDCISTSILRFLALATFIMPVRW